MLKHKEMKDKCRTQKKNIHKYYLSISCPSSLITDKLFCALKMSNCFFKADMLLSILYADSSKSLVSSSYDIGNDQYSEWQRFLGTSIWWKSNSFSLRRNTMVWKRNQWELSFQLAANKCKGFRKSQNQLNFQSNHARLLKC